MFFQLLGQKMPPCNLQLFFIGVGAQFNDLHPVEQRPRDGVGGVGGGDEHALVQVERHLKIVVAEGRILRGIEHLQQRRGGVSFIVAAELVDLIEQQQRVF